MTEKVSVFLPTRKGSERVINKNTRYFAGVKGGLLSIKLQQLLKLEQVTEIVLSTNDPASIEVARSIKERKIKIIQRPEELALSTTNLSDLIDYAPGICQEEHLLWTHVTSPFTTDKEYHRAINDYFKALNTNQFDSLMSGRWFQNFLWSPTTNTVINKEGNLKWPRTQDLVKLFEVDSAIFLAAKTVYYQEKDRVGKFPFLFEQKSQASFDVDWEDDFEIAEKLYTKKQEND